jgi:hypothetical protein
MRRPTKDTGTHRAVVQEHEIVVSVVSIERDDKPSLPIASPSAHPNTR